MAAETALARAKVNLCLHVTGRRADGYHLLDSLVVFADFGDEVSVSPADRLSLTVIGPEGAGLDAGPDNLCLRAAKAFGLPHGAAITLEKKLPVASGIGGGSADAAAVLVALSRLWRVPLPAAKTVLALGADVPVCLAGQAARMRGVGERIDPIPDLPAAWLVLANPRVGVATPAVFRALSSRENPGLPVGLPRWTSAESLAAFLHLQRNDLEPAALTVAPQIGQVLAALSGQGGCLLARMSGSGATCFGLFARQDQAADAARELHRAHPDWWVTLAPMAG